MGEKRVFRYWLEKLGYEWIGDNHPTHPIKRPLTRKFTKEEFLFDANLFEKSGHIRKK